MSEIAAPKPVLVTPQKTTNPEHDIERMSSPPLTQVSEPTHQPHPAAAACFWCGMHARQHAGGKREAIESTYMLHTRMRIHSCIVTLTLWFFVCSLFVLRSSSSSSPHSPPHQLLNDLSLKNTASAVVFRIVLTGGPCGGKASKKETQTLIFPTHPLYIYMCMHMHRPRIMTMHMISMAWATHVTSYSYI